MCMYLCFLEKECTGKPLQNGGFEILHGSKGNTILNYYCDSGYELMGDSVQPCLGQEGWGSEMAACKSRFESKFY